MDAGGSLEVPAGEIEAFCRRWKIATLALFGSAARGELRGDSDVDVLVAPRPDAGWSLFDLGDMQQELSDLFGRDVDIVEEGTIRNPFRRRSILRDRKVIYAA